MEIIPKADRVWGDLGLHEVRQEFELVKREETE
jgi:hypothetical protein